MRRARCSLAALNPIQAVPALFIEFVGVVFEQHLAETIDASERGAQVVGDRITEGHQFLVYRLGLRCMLFDALFELFVEQFDLVQGCFQLHGALLDPAFEGLVESMDHLLGSLAVGNVAEVPHPTVIGAVLALQRRAVAVEGSPVLEQNLVTALLVRMIVEVGYPCKKLLWVDQLV
jgi:hypothetical protein